MSNPYHSIMLRRKQVKFTFKTFYKTGKKIINLVGKLRIFEAIFKHCVNIFIWCSNPSERIVSHYRALSLFRYTTTTTTETVTLISSSSLPFQ